MFKSLTQNIPDPIKKTIKQVMGQPTQKFALSSIDEFCTAKVPNAQGVSAADWTKEIFKCYYEKLDPSYIVPEATIKFASSWIPFIPNSTSVLLYNFFDSNYGIRDPMFYRCSLVHDGRDVLSVKSIVTRAGEVRLIDMNEIFPGQTQENLTILIQAFHPRVSTPANQLRYFVLYRDDHKNFVSGVHSFVFNDNSFPHMDLAARGTSPKLTDYIGRHYSFDNHQDLINLSVAKDSGANAFEKSEFGTSLGYFSLERSQGSTPHAFWHDGPSLKVPAAAQAKKIGAPATWFFIPKNYTCDAFLDEGSLGFAANQVKVEIFDLEHKNIFSRDLRVEPAGDVIEINGSYGPTNIDRYVKMTFAGDLGDYEKLPEVYAQLFYRSAENFCDQVHSHSGSYGFSNSLKPEYKSYRSKKFAPLIKSENAEMIYSIVNDSPVPSKHGASDYVYLRIITDTGFETKFKFPLSLQGITLIRSENLLAKYGEHIHHAAILQLEHDLVNLNGSWHVLSKDRSTLAVDHFTGG